MRHARWMGASCLVVFLGVSALTLTGCDSGKPAQGTGNIVKDAPPPDTAQGGMSSEQFYKDQGKKK